MYGYENDEKLKVDQLKMWENVIKEEVKFDKKYISPFRHDITPKCYFTWVGDLLVFTDWGDTKIHKTYHDLNQPLLYTKESQTQSPTSTFSSIISKKRDWNKYDAMYWKQYNIKKEYLEKEHCHANSWFQFYSKRKNKYFSRSLLENQLSYTIKVENYIKLYNPYIAELKWISNIPQSIIGGADDLPLLIDTLIVQKAFKDYLICKYVYSISCVWLQSENITPDTLLPIIKRANKVVIMFDNDEAGKKGGENLLTFLKTSYPQNNISCVFTKEAKNVSDMIEKGYEKKLINLIKKIK